MAENNPEKLSERKLEDLDIATAAKIISHGGRFHLTLRSVDINFWGLKRGDWVLVKITKVKRALPGDRGAS